LKVIDIIFTLSFQFRFVPRSTNKPETAFGHSALIIILSCKHMHTISHHVDLCTSILVLMHFLSSRFVILAFQYRFRFQFSSRTCPRWPRIEKDALNSPPHRRHCCRHCCPPRRPRRPSVNTPRRRQGEPWKATCSSFSSGVCLWISTGSLAAKQTRSSKPQTGCHRLRLRQ